MSLFATKFVAARFIGRLESTPTEEDISELRDQLGANIMFRTFREGESCTFELWRLHVTEYDNFDEALEALRNLAPKYRWTLIPIAELRRGSCHA